MFSQLIGSIREMAKKETYAERLNTITERIGPLDARWRVAHFGAEGVYPDITILCQWAAEELNRKDLEIAELKEQLNRVQADPGQRPQP